ncbi:Uma2 family endonuclease [Sorangium sp. So ce1335]|uniref:Uma2 family endonuclease n=1 Tax=Sorangium sp. So ce1335 TaxID=3133335 RepID=UPI003F5F87BA
MNEPARKILYTHAEYLEQERASPTKHEFLNGEIFAMAGGTPEHARLSASVIAELRAQLRGRPCAVYASDLRVRVQATGLSTYPDVSVVCGRLERDIEDNDAALNPIVLVEVGLPRPARAGPARRAGVTVRRRGCRALGG